jgi:hypothetical protein
MQYVSDDWKLAQTQRFAPPAHISISIDVDETTGFLFYAEDIVSFILERQGDLLSGRLPTDKVTWTVDNSDGSLDFVAVGNRLTEASLVMIHFGFEINDTVEWILGGQYFLTDWEIPANGITASFTANNILSYLTDTYTGRRTGTLSQIASAVQRQEYHLPNGTPVLIDTTHAILNTEVDFSADTTEYSLAEVLQLIANAARCVIYVDRAKMINIAPLDTDLSDYVINKSLSYKYPQVTLTKPIKNVVVEYASTKLTTAVNTVGEDLIVSSPLIIYEEDAINIAGWASDTYDDRQKFTCSYRADPRLDLYDMIQIQLKDDSYVEGYVEFVKYQFTGSWKADIECRVLVGGVTTIADESGNTLTDESENILTA